MLSLCGEWLLDTVDLHAEGLPPVGYPQPLVQLVVILIYEITRT